MTKSHEQSKTRELKKSFQTMDGNSCGPQQELSGLMKSKCTEIFIKGKIDQEKIKQTLGKEIAKNSDEKCKDLILGNIVAKENS